MNDIEKVVEGYEPVHYSQVVLAIKEQYAWSIL
jgi:hypothetical protein